MGTRRWALALSCGTVAALAGIWVGRAWHHAPPPPPVSPLEALTGAMERELAAQPTPPGTGQISGRVRSDDGAGVAGVCIEAVPVLRGAAGVATLADRALQSERRRRAQRSAITDASGAFRLDGLVDSPHRLFARASGWRLSRNAPAPTSGDPLGASVEWTAERASVVRPDLPLPPSASVELWATRHVGATVTDLGPLVYSAAGPAVALPLGEYRVRLRWPAAPWVPQALTRAADEVSVSIAPAAAETRIPCAPPSAAAIYGVVLEADGCPAPAAVVYAWKAGALPQDDGATIRASARRVRGPLWTGRFALGDLEPGPWSFAAAAVDGGRLTRFPPQTLAPGLHRRTFRLDAPAPSDLVEIEVRAAPDTPAPRVPPLAARWGPEGGATIQEGLVMRPSDAHRWRVYLSQAAAEARAGGALRLLARAPDDGVVSVPVPVAAEPVALRLDARATVRIRFRDYAGSAAVGRLRVRMIPVPVLAPAGLLRPGRSAYQARTGLSLGNSSADPISDGAPVPPSGELVLSDLPPGRYRCEVFTFIHFRSQLSEFWRVDTREVDLPGGETTIECAPPDLHPVTIVVEGADPGESIALWPPGRPDDWGLESFCPDRTGILKLDHLPAGTYRVGTGPLPGPTDVEFRVPDQSRVVLHLR